MKVDILSLFPDMFSGPFDSSIIKRAVGNKLVEIKIHDLRAWAKDRYKTVDDKPFGGGAGMVLKVDIIDRAVTDIKAGLGGGSKTRVVLLDAAGNRFDQQKAMDIIICGHYEGVDYRVHEYLADEVISVGEFIASGGEIPAMMMVDAVVRLIPGAVGNKESVKFESFTEDKDLVEYPQYTRPGEYKGWKVPDILLSGDHKKIAVWRKQKMKRSFYLPE